MCRVTHTAAETQTRLKDFIDDDGQYYMQVSRRLSATRML